MREKRGVLPSVAIPINAASLIGRNKVDGKFEILRDSGDNIITPTQPISSPIRRQPRKTQSSYSFIEDLEGGFFQGLQEKEI